MKSQNDILALIRSIAGQANVLTIPRVFVELTGDIKTALFLSQCCYWASKMGGRFYKTQASWTEEISLSRHEIDRARKEVADIVRVELHKANGVPTAHYYVDFDKLGEKLVALLNSANGFVDYQQTGLLESDKPLTETSNNKIQDIIIYEPCNEDGEIIKPKQKKERRKPAESLFGIANAIAEVCGMSLAINEGRIFREAKLLSVDPRVTPELILKIYGKGGQWFKYDWRGKQNQKPKIANIAETIFLFEDEQDNTIKGGLYTR